MQNLNINKTLFVFPFESLKLAFVGLLITINVNLIKVFAQIPLVCEPENFTANASPVVGSDGKLYVFAATPQYAKSAHKVFNVISTSDLVNWEMHDSVLRMNDINWAHAGVYGGAVLYHNGKYNIFYETRKTDKPGQYVGIAQSESPLGPFVNITDEPLIKMMDPCTFKDDDGCIYIYAQRFALPLDNSLRPIGGNKNLEFKGKELTLNGWGAVHVFKRNNLYYWVATEKNNYVTYWVSDNALGPFTYKGVLMPGNASGDNHTSIVKYKDKYVFFYEYNFRNMMDNTVKSKRICAENLNFNTDGSIGLVLPSLSGLAYQNKDTYGFTGL